LELAVAGVRFKGSAPGSCSQRVDKTVYFTVLFSDPISAITPRIPWVVPAGFTHFRERRGYMRGNWITLRALDAGVAVPFLYYGAQAIAAPFFSGFSIMSSTASELGSDHSTHPSVFNAGAILQGVACLVASVGFFRAFGLLGTHPVLAWLTSLAVATSGLSSLWAGYFPLPDPRHVGHPAFLIAILSLPPLFAVALWRRGPNDLETSSSVAETADEPLP
jgi:Protein of unknown function (DUF998)